MRKDKPSSIGYGLSLLAPIPINKHWELAPDFRLFAFSANNRFPLVRKML